MSELSVFAPASVGNIGPAFDVLGMALADMGDTLSFRRTLKPGILIEEITGDGGKLPYAADENTAGIAAQAVLDILKVREGLVMRIDKAIPGSGLGSSAASAVAGAFGANLLFEGGLSKEELLPLAAVAESKVSGALFFDNIGPSMLGGITWSHPETQEVHPLGWIEDLVVIVATPDFSLLTRETRAVLPRTIPMADFISNMAYAAMIAWSVAAKDAKRFGRAVNDHVAEVARAPFIKGFADVKRAALSTGALGCSISGAGASVFAVSDDAETGAKIGAAMKEAFRKNQVAAQIRVTRMDRLGVRLVDQAFQSKEA